MANLKDIRIRIASVKSTQQITSAMKMVSAAKLRKAQDAIIQLRPYSEGLNQLLNNILANNSISGNQFTNRPQIDKVLILAITSDRGLCGGFNANVVKEVVAQIEHQYVDYLVNSKLDIIVIGKKGFDGLNARKIKCDNAKINLFENLNFERASIVSQSIVESYLKKEYDKVVVVYNNFKNAVVQEVVVEQFLPIDTSAIKNINSKIKSDYIFEPNAVELLNMLIPQALNMLFFKAVLSSVASEHGARMTAMHKATDNAIALTRELKLNYNKARQASITSEILEIVSGANALREA